MFYNLRPQIHSNLNFLQMISEEKGGKKATCLDIWNRTHTRAGSELDENGMPLNYTTPAAMEIAVRILIMMIYMLVLSDFFRTFIVSTSICLYSI